MKYNGLTSVGSIYQAKCAANNIPVKFVKVKVGNELFEETENPLNFTDIKSLKKEVGISEITQVNEAVRLTVPLDNDGVTEGYYPREFGIYVEDDGVEVLYWYINDGQEASYLPPQSSAPVKIKNHFNIIATSLESLIVNWDGKEFWVDKEYLGKELAKKEDKIEIKESAFNRPFGTLENEVLEGIQLARTLGLEYGGELNNSNIKTIDTVYYDTQNKSFFKCFQENSLNYADSNYYEGISNNDLLLKLQNLTNEKQLRFEMGNVTVVLTKIGKIVMCAVQHQGGVFNASLPVGTIPLDFRGEYAIYLTVPCITGSPYISLKTDGSVEFRINDATFQTLTTNTSYFLTQSYFSKLY